MRPRKARENILSRLVGVAVGRSIHGTGPAPGGKLLETEADGSFDPAIVVHGRLSGYVDDVRISEIDEVGQPRWGRSARFDGADPYRLLVASQKSSVRAVNPSTESNGDSL